MFWPTTVSVLAAAAPPVMPALGDGSPVPAVLFYCFTALVLGAAFTVALARNIVRAATGLLFALAGMAGFYFLLEAEFLAAVQLVVYVGGTLILVIFGVMLTSQSPSIRYNPKPYEVSWAVVIGLMITMAMVLLMVSVWGQSVLSGVAPPRYPLAELGKALIDPNGYLAPFELVSVVLLAVMIGAAYLAKGRKGRA